MTPNLAFADLTGKLLIAMPDMGDPRFHGSVVFLCAHSPDGSMGLIVNKPMPDVRFSEMLEQLDIPRGAGMPDLPVCYGGPVEVRRGFVLHNSGYRGRQDDQLRIGDSFAMTATIDVLEDLARGGGPERALMALGYAGWGPGQLEDEIAQNGWLTADATPEIVFAERMEGKWSAALATLGVSPLTLSSEAGRA
ncbi:YqgE/AlgH family protein [Roseicyclus marinus]|uniref:YqgE/AlgH family protein n=1 Tax=Roseicyclus marinus TaxID=2161673 RepID=UPI0024103AB1|nr:YqgE/AlgH family protein [Roseicyclus marinus]MDG3041096.1 YqgE/AlgH family protein [Roseicyclus marinus]